MAIRLVGRKGLRVVLRDLRSVRATFRGRRREFMTKAVERAKEAFRLQFARQGAEFGSAWEELADATLARKAAEGGGRRILVRSGRLRDSLARNPVVRIAGEVLVIESTRSEGGVSLVQAHDEGLGVAVRRVTHPATGISGRALIRIGDDLEALADNIANRLVGR